ncbi:MAG: hypothetical protein LWX51_04710 [Deltaproteobacteria bacterium]|nr:hypothetical protein [Deltaproteobacteria bacterium]
MVKDKIILELKSVNRKLKSNVT